MVLKPRKKIPVLDRQLPLVLEGVGEERREEQRTTGREEREDPADKCRREGDLKHSAKPRPSLAGPLEGSLDSRLRTSR